MLREDKMRKSLYVGLFIIFTLVISFVVKEDVFAGGGAASGVDASGGSCEGGGNVWWDTCFGYSWQKYEVTKDLPEDGVSLHHTDNTGGPVYIKGCKSGQTIFNYGLEVYKGSNGNGQSLGYQVSTQKFKGGTQADHNSEAKGAYNYNGSKNTISNYTRPVGYATKDEAMNAFEVMTHYVEQHPNTPFVGDKSIDWDEVGAFCYEPDAETEINEPFIAKSNVSNGVGYTTTNLVYENSGALVTANTDPIREVAVGVPVNLKFSHDLYAMKSGVSAKWVILRDFLNNDNYDIDTSGQGARDGTAVFTDKLSDLLYMPNYRPYNDGVNSYMARDNYTVTFMSAGTYEFCETLVLDDNEIMTKVCAKYEVKNEGIAPTYVVKSNVSNGKKYNTTNLVYDSMAPKTIYTSFRTVKMNTPVSLIFSHNLYATKLDENNTGWSIERSFGVGNYSNYEINSVEEGNSSGSVSFTDKTNEFNVSLYQPSNRPYSDGANSYLARDNYTVTFRSKGGYAFCETLSLSNPLLSNLLIKEKLMTTVCARYDVRDDAGGDEEDDEEDNTDNPCYRSDWVPQSYNDSDELSGKTSVLSKVRNATLGGDYTDSVFAKPTDNINWIHCYYPGVQKVANTMATGKGVILPGIGNHGKHDPNLGADGTTQNKYSKVSVLYGNWKNYFNVVSTNLRNPIPNRSPSNGNYSAGDATVRALRDDSYNVEYGRGKNRAGKILTETAMIGSPAFAEVTNDGPHNWDCNKKEDPSCGCAVPVCDKYKQSCDANGKNCVNTSECEESHCGAYNSCYISKCKHSNDYIGVNWENSADSDKSSASVKVPYNFINTATISLSSTYVYAGEIATIGSSDVQIRTKNNGTTGGIYATQVDDAKVKFVAYLSSSNSGSVKEGVGSGKDYNICNALSGTYEICNELNGADNNTLNASGALGLGTAPKTKVASASLTSILGSNYNVYDATAGKYYCVVAAVYPYTSGSDTNMNASGSNNWYVSAPSCAVIAKKPSLQVWGNGLYTAGKVDTASAEKRVINGFVEFTAQNASNTTIFGSWVETNVIANGQITGLASGAATGFPGSTTRTSIGLGGSKEGSTRRFCAYRSPLTMPNASCIGGNGIPGINWSTIGVSNAKMNKPVDRDELISRFMNEDNIENDTNYTTLSSFANDKFGNGVRVIPAGQYQTYVIDVSGKDFVIDTNIQYEDGLYKGFDIDLDAQHEESYKSFLEIPKLIIRADNIKINCNVTRIDAVLIADKIENGNIKGNVDTCANSTSGVNDGARSNQLKINGAIITGSMTAKRTYGAGIGQYSVIPAEIIDYDTSLYLWSAPRADVASSGKLDVVYMQELSPRL